MSDNMEDVAAMLPPVPGPPDIEWAPDHRSLVTTHRIRQADGSPPVQTRELPWPLWPFELVSRLEARVRYLLYERDRRRAGW